MAKKAKTRVPRVSGKLTGMMLQDLCKRLEKQLSVAEALRDVAAPHGGTMSGAWPMLKVLELAAAEHAQSLAQITMFAKIISERRPA
jgi:hypothetical protein